MIAKPEQNIYHSIGFHGNRIPNKLIQCNATRVKNNPHHSMLKNSGGQIRDHARIGRGALFIGAEAQPDGRAAHSLRPVYGGCDGTVDSDLPQVQSSSAAVLLSDGGLRSCHARIGRGALFIRPDAQRMRAFKDLYGGC